MTTEIKNTLTTLELALFTEYAKDAPNWAGCPMVGGNVTHNKERDGVLTSLKKKGLVQTFGDSDNKRIVWLEFTDDGRSLAASIGHPIND